MKGLHGWMRTLEKSEAAVLSTLLKELDQVTGDEESSGMQLAEVIMKDAGLTASIIRVANSVTFNPSGVSVTTVSRAVINIGFKNIRSICLSIKVLETVLKDSPSSSLVAMLARSLHGASQSKALCHEFTHTEQEEVFVASLLSHLAELLLLGVNEEEVKLFKNEIEPHTSSVDKNRCAERLLGVSLSRLSKTLMKQWRIEGLVGEVLNEGEEVSRRVQAIKLGNEISRAALFGWESDEFEAACNDVAEFTGKGKVETKNSLIKVADSVAETVATFGRKTLTEHIPTSSKEAMVDIKDEEESLLMPDMSAELKVSEMLQELTNTSPVNINKVFRLVLKGLNEGIGLERVAVAIFEKEHQKVSVKYSVGVGTEDWASKFSVRYERSRSGFLYNLFERDQVVWVGGKEYRHISQFLTPEYKGITGQSRFFIAPLLSGSRKIGFIYADLGQSERDLDTRYLEGFHNFYNYARDALESLS